MRKGTTLNDLMQWDDTLFDGILLPDEVNHELLVSYIVLACGLQEVLYQEYNVFKSHVHVWFAAHNWNIQKLINLIKQKYEPLWNYDKFEEIEGTKKFDGTRNTEEERDTDRSGDITTEFDRDKSVNDKYGGADTLNRTDTFGEVNGRNLTTNRDTTTTNNLSTDTTENSHEETAGTQTKSVTAFNTSAWQDTERVVDSRETDAEKNGHETNTGTVDVDETITETGNTNKTGSNNRVDTETYGKTLDTTTDEQTTNVEKLNTHEDRDTVGKEVETNTTDTTETSHKYGNIGLTTYQKMFLEEYDLLDGVNLYEWITNKFTNELMIGVYV